MQATAVTGTITKGKLKTTAALTIFPDDTEVIILSRADWQIIAGSDSTRSQLDAANKKLADIQRNPDKAAEILEARKWTQQ